MSAAQQAPQPGLDEQSETVGTTTGVIYYETKVAELLGISRPDLTSIRKQILKKEEGWRLEGRDVVYTRAGLDQVLKHLRLDEIAIDISPAIVPSFEKAGPEKKDHGTAQDPDAATNELPPGNTVPPENGLVQLTVHRIYPNDRLLQARTDAGELVDVGVKSNRNFRPRDHKGRPMTLQGRLVRPGRYEMEGRCPRFPGRY